LDEFLQISVAASQNIVHIRKFAVDDRRTTY